MPIAPEFSSLVVSRPHPRALLFAKLRGMAIAAAVYALGLGTVVLVPLLMLEVVEPPRASVDLFPHVVFHPPHGRGTRTPSGHIRNGVAGLRGGARPAAPPRQATSRPVSRPTDSPMPLPAPESAVPPGADRGPGEGNGIPGDPNSGGDDPDGTPGPPCPGCPPGPDGPPGGPDGPYDEGTLGLTPALLVAGSRALPKYPDLARRAGLQGTVVLLAVIEKDGRVGEIEVVKSPDQRWGFDLAAIEAVKQWRYRPALMNGAPVAAYIQVMVEFTLAR